ncbi:CopG family transcriptional regulator [Kocuria sp. cx-116]|uniref:CopG family transcriptional regulator n=1 Tax=Kocuria sp. cx-116 TaxID=2771378 RepID=UPI0016853AC8|nr:CopG family transcriptional regulator [Kocuria sp. cx-116]MBD2763288.1 CopG family transcriptional regulator [Kocuria sp. cx-116]
MAMTLRLTPEDENLLAELAAQEGVSRQEATVRAIRETAARRGHESAVKELSAAARERYADLLDRLGR